MDIGATLTDAHILGPWFAGESWRGWRTILRAAHGEADTR
jgi:hypothetical protein